MICDYGCGQEAKYQFKNGKWCCSKHRSQCPYVKQEISNQFKGEKNPWYGKKRDGENNPMWGKKHSKETIKKIIKNRKNLGEKIKRSYTNELKEIRRQKALELWEDKTFRKRNEKAIKKSWANQEVINKHKRSIEDINKKYPLFTKIEEMRYNPDKLEEKEIQVRCKNHNCKNSKEQGGWFTPTDRQIEMRITALENNGVDLSYFYCSDECKNKCPLYNSKGVDPFKNNESSYTPSEYNQFREHILTKDNHICQYCGEKAEHVHHERPQKLEPFYSLDPDLAWSVCSKCHYEKGHKDECSTGQLANKVCKQG